MKNIRKRFGEFLGVISIIGLFLYIEYGKEVGIYLILLLPTAIASLYLTFYEYIVAYRQHIEYEYRDYHDHDIIHAARKCKRAIYAISISFILMFLFPYIYISLDIMSIWIFRLTIIISSVILIIALCFFIINFLRIAGDFIAFMRGRF